MKKIALIGANGMLATAIKKHAPDCYLIEPMSRPDFDLTRADHVRSLGGLSPDIIINCAAYTNVDGCETNQEEALSVNGKGPALLAEAARDMGAVLVHISTDFVFNGKKRSPYREDDPTEPLSEYGRTKLAGERGVVQSGLRKYFIIRTSWLYGDGGGNFVETMRRLAGERTELKIVDDQVGTPTWTEDLAQTIFDLLETEQYGFYHYSNEGECSWYDFACEVIALVGRDEHLKVKEIVPIPTAEYPLPAERPKYSVLSKEKIQKVTARKIPGWATSLKNYLKH